MACTNWDTDRKRRRPPAWDPPKLLLVVGGLNVVVGTLSVVGVVIDGGVWLLAPAYGCENQVEGKGGKEGEKQP